MFSLGLKSSKTKPLYQYYFAVEQKLQTEASRLRAGSREQQSPGSWLHTVANSGSVALLQILPEILRGCCCHSVTCWPRGAAGLSLQCAVGHLHRAWHSPGSPHLDHLQLYSPHLPVYHENQLQFVMYMGHNQFSQPQKKARTGLVWYQHRTEILALVACHTKAKNIEFVPPICSKRCPKAHRHLMVAGDKTKNVNSTQRWGRVPERNNSCTSDQLPVHYAEWQDSNPARTATFIKL